MLEESRSAPSSYCLDRDGVALLFGFFVAVTGVSR